MRKPVTAIVLVAVLGACSKPATPSVPQLPATGGASAAAQDHGDQNLNAVAGDASAARRAKLHAAAQCIRQHGAPNYQDPVLSSDGYVYTDEIALRSLDAPQLDAAQTACQDLIHAANFTVRDQGPPPPKLVRAGVKSAECMRAHGLPDFKDPTVDSPFAPGRGFGVDPDSLPPGGKQSPILQRAAEACRAVLDAEESASSLGNLGNA
jgi:hypothetical protein